MKITVPPEYSVLDEEEGPGLQIEMSIDLERFGVTSLKAPCE